MADWTPVNPDPASGLNSGGCGGGGFKAGRIVTLVCRPRPRKCWDIVGLLQGSKGLSLENPEKRFEKGFPGPLGPGAEKVRKRAENEPKTRKKIEKLPFLDSFSSFSDPGAGRPREPLYRLFFGAF